MPTREASKKDKLLWRAQQAYKLLKSADMHARGNYLPGVLGNLKEAQTYLSEMLGLLYSGPIGESLDAEPEAEPETVYGICPACSGTGASRTGPRPDDSLRCPTCHKCQGNGRVLVTA